MKTSKNEHKGAKETESWDGWGCVGIMVLGLVVLAMLPVAIGVVRDEIIGWFSVMESPGERAGAYVAVAIGLHALVLAFKEMRAR